MTEQPVNEHVGDTFDFDGWLAGITPVTTSVDILQDPALLAEYEAWERRYQHAQASDPGEYSAGEKNPIRALEAEGEALLDRIEQSRSTWFLRGLSEVDERAIVAAFPDPSLPDDLRFTESPPRMVESPTEAQAKAFTQGYEVYRDRRSAWLTEHDAELRAYGEQVQQVARDRAVEKIARAVARVEQSGRVLAEGLTSTQAKRLIGAIGEAQSVALLEAVKRASESVPEVPMRPLSHGSGSDPE